jgi:hypothetical protein
MSPIIELIKALVPHIPSQQERDEEYLNEAVDIYDVERRIWEIDHRGNQAWTQAGGLGGVLH